jgi:hypothetical protein
MLGFIKDLFRGFVLFFLWINLFFSIVCGWIIGDRMERYYSDGYSVIGVIIGLIVGIIIDVIFGGFVATILNIDRNLEELNTRQKNGMSKNIQKNEISLNKSNFARNNFAEDSDFNDDEVFLEENECFISEEIKLYEEPNVNSKIVWRLLKGEVAIIIDKKRINNILWYNLKDKEENNGWCMIDSDE